MDNDKNVFEVVHLIALVLIQLLLAEDVISNYIINKT